MYILTIDQSTSTTKAIIFDEKFKLIGRYNRNHSQIYSTEGWIEHDPEEIYNNMIISIKKVIEKTEIEIENIKVLSISSKLFTIKDIIFIPFKNRV